MGGIDLRPQIEKFSRRFAEVEMALNDPKVFGNNQRAQELAREYARLKELIGAGQAYLKTVADLEANRNLLGAEANDSELALLAREEISRLEREEKRLALAVQSGILPPDPADSRNTIVEIRAGAGGSESALFAADLYRMHALCGRPRLEGGDLDSAPSDLGGFKEIIFGVTGTEVYKLLKYESGVHRVQRVPPPKPRAAFIPAPPPSPSCPKPRKSILPSNRKSWRSPSAALPVPADRASTRPIPPCRSCTNRPV